MTTVDQIEQSVVKFVLRGLAKPGTATVAWLLSFLGKALSALQYHIIMVCVVTPQCTLLWFVLLALLLLAQHPACGLECQILCSKCVHMAWVYECVVCMWLYIHSGEIYHC